MARRYRPNPTIDERTVRLRALRIAAEASQQLDQELVTRAEFRKRLALRSVRTRVQAIRVEDLNAANDK